MKSSDKIMWKINIENAASAVAAEYGSSTVNSVFAKYNAHGFHDLSSCYFSEVFADLELMANENQKICPGQDVKLSGPTINSPPVATGVRSQLMERSHK